MNELKSTERDGKKDLEMEKNICLPLHPETCYIQLGHWHGKIAKIKAFHCEHNATCPYANMDSKSNLDQWYPIFSPCKLDGWC